MNLLFTSHNTNIEQEEFETNENGTAADSWFIALDVENFDIKTLRYDNNITPEVLLKEENFAHFHAGVGIVYWVFARPGSIMTKKALVKWGKHMLRRNGYWKNEKS